MTDRVAQAVLFGSVELALKQSFINIDDLLEWLSKQSVTQEITIAYNAVCRRLTPNLQYLKDGVHVLAKNPALAAVAVMHKLDPSIKDRKEGESKELWNYVFEAVIKMRNDHTAKGKGLIMLTGSGSNDLLRSNIDLLYGCRFWREVPGVSTDSTNVALLKTDWVEHLRSNGTVASAILKRVHFLQQHAPQYYGEVAYKQYYAKAAALHKEQLLTNLTQADLILFNTYFTNIIDTRLLSYDSLCYNIASLTPDVAGYVLGFPIHWFIPNAEQIHEALATLKAKGIDDYCAYIKAESVANSSLVGAHVTKDVTFSNTEDVYGEDIDNYVSFDIIVFRNAKHIYRFTRPEFSNLVKSKKNHWTNEWLPASIVGTIKSRLATACALGLPESHTLKEHLNHVKNHNFFKSTVDPITRSTPVTTTVPRTVPSPGGRTTSLPVRVVPRTATFRDTPLNMDFDGDEPLNTRAQFVEQLQNMFGNVIVDEVTGTPMVDSQTANIFTRQLVTHEDEYENENDEDEDDEDEDDDNENENHIAVIPVDVLRANLFSPNQERPSGLVMARVNNRIPSSVQQPNGAQHGLAIDVRALAREWAINPQMLDVARRVSETNTNPEELLRLVFDTTGETSDPMDDVD